MLIFVKEYLFLRSPKDKSVIINSTILFSMLPYLANGSGSSILQFWNFVQGVTNKLCLFLVGGGGGGGGGGVFYWDSFGV